jgi:putative ABC transport system permease protein
MGDFFRDLKQSLRMFSKSPGFTFAAITALALGIAATTAIFSIVNAVLLRPLPVRDPDRFVILLNNTVDPKGKTGTNPYASPAKFAYWKTLTNVFEDVGASASIALNYTGGDKPEQLSAAQVSAGSFKVWGIPILRGRSFAEAEDSPHGPHVALISEDFWKTRLAADPQAVGRVIELNSEPYTIIGVVAYTPAWEEFGPVAYGRLKSGVALRQAQAALAASSTGFREKFPLGMGPNDTFTTKTYKEFLIGDTRLLLWVMLGAVGFVLLIACANVANLLLARATSRRREIAIRAAIGAARGRVVRQLLTESLLLSLVGGALGAGLGYAGIRALLAVNNAGLPRVGNDGVALWIDWRMLAFALAASLATGIIFGLFPALQGSRADLNVVLKESSGRSGTGLRQNKARAALVVSEVGLSVVLLVGAALLIRTFVALYAVDPGFDPHNTLTMRMLLTGEKYQKTAAVSDAMRDGLDRIRALPGVVSAAVTDFLPLQMGASMPFNVTGRAPQQGAFEGVVSWCPVGPSFFETFKVPVKRGRAFNDRDDAKAPPVVIINEAMAKQYWKSGDPLRDRLAIGHGLQREFNEDPVRQIVGIVADVHNSYFNVEPKPMVFVPIAQTPDNLNAFLVRMLSISWAVRTQGEPHRMTAAIREELRQATGLPVTNIRSMDEVVSLATARQRFNMLLMSVFGLTALLLAAIGIYGLMAYTVEQRTHEIGIRLALGAESVQVRNMVVRQGMTLALAGVALGLAAAWALVKLIESLLFGVKARDPLVFVAVPLTLALVAWLAVLLPALRASRVSPVDSLRYQ